MTIQTTYTAHQGKGYAGQLARPNEAYSLDKGQAGEAVKAGDGVIFDGMTSVKPTSDAGRLEVNAIVSYDVGVVADGGISYAADQSLKLAVAGVYHLVAGEDLSYGDRIIFNQTTGKWVKAASNADPKLLVTVIQGGANGDLIEARIHGLTR